MIEIPTVSFICWLIVSAGAGFLLAALIGACITVALLEAAYKRGLEEGKEHDD